MQGRRPRLGLGARLGLGCGPNPNPNPTPNPNQADALGRICAEPPCTPTASFLGAAYECRTVREFLLTPQGGGQGGGQGAFGDAAWLAAELDARQSIGEM